MFAGKTKDAGRRSIQFRLRGDGSIFADRDALLAESEQLRGEAQTVFAFLIENGASYVRDIEMGTGLSFLQLQAALGELADKGLVSCENYETFLMVLQSAYNKGPANTRMVKKTRQHLLKKVPQRAMGSAIRKMVQEQTRIRDGRWFLTTSFAVMGKLLSTPERTVAQARLLLQRYGILVKEFYRREFGLLPWYTIFQCLKRLEWQGEIRRGYFVEGLSGVQFALPEALDLLEKIHNEQLSTGDQPVLLSSLDPALPYGGMVDWELTDTTGDPLKIIRSPSNHLAFLDGRPVLYAENFFQRLSSIADMQDNDFAITARLFGDWLKLPSLLRPKNRIEISQIDHQGAATHKLVKQFLKLGYEKEGDRLTLWPSAV
ncbi:MAG: hypothetical protein JSU83_22415 [Deltaproteobacteria bacterium]|nr:MAG: hypothetical protein JSU83_22415 [Deltaproteobacteria bacterium]